MRRVPDMYMSKFNVSTFARLMAVALAMIVSVSTSSALAAPIWSASGPGTVTVTDADIGDDLQAEFTYLHDPAGFGTSTWTFRATATETGPVTIDYEWTGFHAFFQVTTFLRTVDSGGTSTIVSEGPINCCTSPSAGFTYVGEVTLNAVAGQPYGFDLGGSNFDSNNKLSGTFTIQGHVVDANACLPSSGGCNPSGVQKVELPAGIDLDPEDTLTQELVESAPGLVNFLDPRVDSFGQCWDRRELDVFGDDSLILPVFLCGSPEFAVLRSEASFDVVKDVIRSEQLPEALFAETFDCAGPVSPINEAQRDLQRRGVFTWQPDEKSEVAEMRTLELSNGCGSSRGATRGLSFFVLNLHIDCGIEFGMNHPDVLECLKDLTDDKLEVLQEAVLAAEGVFLGKNDFKKLKKRVGQTIKQLDKGNFSSALAHMQNFLRVAESAEFGANGGFNTQGNLLMRAENIEFIIDEKLRLAP